MGIKIKASNVGDLRADLEKQAKKRSSSASSNVKFATWIPHQDDQELRVRFLTNPDNGGWLTFEQVRDPAKKGPQILTDDNTEYYEQKRHDSGGKDYYPSVRFYAPILDIKSNEVKVIEIPYGRKGAFVQTILGLGDRWGEQAKSFEGDVTAFDIALYKTGYGVDTIYHAEFAGFADIDLSDKEVPDLWATLEAKVAYQEGKKLDEAEDATDQIEDEVVSKTVEDEPPFVPDEPKPTVNRTRKIKRPAKA